MDSARGALGLMRTQVATVFTFDAAGRMRSVNEPGGAAAPRFFMGQTPEGNQWWFRHDLELELVRALEALCLRTPVTHDMARPSLRADPYETLLAEHAPIENIWAGPAYYFPNDIEVPADTVLIEEGSRDMLRPYCVEWFDDVSDCQPFAVLPRDGRPAHR